MDLRMLLGKEHLTVLIIKICEIQGPNLLGPNMPHPNFPGAQFARAQGEILKEEPFSSNVTNI